tara:strand:- start:908 stop:1819 length:912 start_codon:yes stop_codon:yes gene_type:complete
METIINLPVGQMNKELPKTLVYKEAPEITVLNRSIAHPSRSDKYSVIKSGEIVKWFESKGFTSKIIAKENPRKGGGYEGYETHFIAFENPNLVIPNEELAKEITPRIYIKNSYHGRSKFGVFIGLFRGWCENGLVFGDFSESLQFRHRGVTEEDLELLLQNVKRKYEEEMIPYVLNLKGIKLSRDEQIAFAKTILDYRLSDVIEKKGENFIGADYETLLTVNRKEDVGNDLWLVCQRIQENLGLNENKPVSLEYQFWKKDKNGERIQDSRKVSHVSNINRSIDLNSKIFEEANKFLHNQAVAA